MNIHILMSHTTTAAILEMMQVVCSDFTITELLNGLPEFGRLASIKRLSKKSLKFKCCSNAVSYIFFSLKLH